MRKITFKAVFITVFFLLIGYASVPMAFGATDKLDKAIRDVSDYLNKRIPKKTKVVFLNVMSDWPDLSEYILSGLSENGVNDGVFSVIDRKQIDVIRQELNFQLSGEVSDASAQKIGEMLGAQTIVSGTVTKIGSVYRIQTRAIEVQTAAVQGQLSLNVDNKGLIVSLTKKVVPAASSPVMAVAATGGSHVAASQPATATAPQSAPATAVAPQPAPVSTSTVTAIEVTAKSGGKLFFQNKEIATLWDNETHTIPVDGPGTYALKMVFADHTETRSVVINSRGITKLSFGGAYTVGQPGPAGGIVFFDKGSYSDGWRFLEAASNDIAGTAEWGPMGKMYAVLIQEEDQENGTHNSL